MHPAPTPRRRCHRSGKADGRLEDLSVGPIHIFLKTSGSASDPIQLRASCHGWKNMH